MSDFIVKVVKIIEQEFKILFEGNTEKEAANFIYYWIEERKLDSIVDIAKRRNIREKYNELAVEMNLL